MDRSTHALSLKLQAVADEGERRRATKLPPVESSTGYVKREVYSLVAKWRGKRITLRDALRASGDLPARSSALEQNPYHWVLLALRRRGYAVVHTEMRRIANELEYASRHVIPVELLVGFLLQTAAGNDIYERVRDETRVEANMLTFPPLKRIMRTSNVQLLPLSEFRSNRSVSATSKALRKRMILARRNRQARLLKRRKLAADIRARAVRRRRREKEGA